jgi:hypothetical protein
MPQWLEITLDVFAVLFRFLGALALGLGFGWFTLDSFRKSTWQVQIAIFLGFVIMALTLVSTRSAGAFGAFGLGAGVALLVWGLAKSGKKEEADEEKKK